MHWANTLMAAALFAAHLIASPGGALAQAQAGGFEPRLEDIETLPPGAGREETFYGCTACHAFKLVAAQGLTRQGWDEQIQLMINRHKMAEPAAEDRKAMLDYLEKNYPPRAPMGGWRNPFAQ
jgi:hypothetical protein